MPRGRRRLSIVNSLLKQLRLCFTSPGKWLYPVLATLEASAGGRYLVPSRLTGYGICIDQTASTSKASSTFLVLVT